MLESDWVQNKLSQEQIVFRMKSVHKARMREYRWEELGE